LSARFVPTCSSRCSQHSAQRCNRTATRHLHARVGHAALAVQAFGNGDYGHVAALLRGIRSGAHRFGSGPMRNAT
jgi:hypothetical protein